MTGGGATAISAEETDSVAGIAIAPADAAGRRCRGRHARAGGGRGDHRGTGTREYPRHIDAGVGLDDDSSVSLARGDLFDVEPVRIDLKFYPLNIQAIPIDEVFVQRIVDGVQMSHADIAGQLQYRLFVRRNAPWRRRPRPLRAASSRCLAQYRVEPPPRGCRPSFMLRSAATGCGITVPVTLSEPRLLTLVSSDTVTASQDPGSPLRP